MGLKLYVIFNFLTRCTRMQNCEKANVSREIERNERSANETETEFEMRFVGQREKESSDLRYEQN